MKIGILTYFWDENPGTFLQAYSTFMIIKTLFSNDHVEMINIKNKIKVFRPAKRDLLSLNKLYKSFVRHRSYKKSLQKMLFSKNGYIGSNPVEALKYINKQSYDVIIVGSDTILELQKCNIKNNILPVYYLEGIKCKKIMVSSSCGSTDINRFNKYLKRAAYYCLNDFIYLGVRDKNTYELITQLKENSENIKLVPDPTYIYEIDLKKAEKALIKYNYDFNCKTVIINLPHNFTALNEIVNYFKEREWKIISFEHTKYADYCLFLDPEEWAGIPYYVDLVITDRFHGSLFSFRNNTPVIGVDCNTWRVSSSNKSKVKSLFEDYNMSNNYINYIENPSITYFINKIDEVIKEKYDFTDINNKMKDEYIAYINTVKKKIYEGGCIG